MPSSSTVRSAASISAVPTPLDRSSGSTDIVSISAARAPTFHDAGAFTIVNIT